jgi:hypothetical protein
MVQAMEPRVPEKPMIGTYLAWLGEKFGKTEVQPQRMRYDTVAAKAKVDIQESAFWKGVCAGFAEFDDEYTQGTSYKLYAQPPDRELQRKPWASFLLKTYRRNILHNTNWPEAPDDGWVEPGNWFARVNDVIRATFVVKYLDGVEFLVNRLETEANNLGLPFSCDFEAKDEGYYAAHTYVQIDVDAPTQRFGTEILPIRLELQVTTQLQEVIRRLTHAQYEVRRVRDRPAMPWQWDFRDESFVPNYLGHILHYLEGMIMEVRERGSGGATNG